MTRTAIRLTIAATLATALLAVPTAAAADHAAKSTGSEAATAIEDSHPEGLFRLTVKPEGGPKTVVRLLCSPDRGSHPDPAAACADLAEADGRVRDIPAESGACTKQFAPVTVTAIGIWHGKPRLYKERFGNGCEAIGKTGGDVFDF